MSSSVTSCTFVILFLFCNVPATTGCYTYSHTLSLRDALPISDPSSPLAWSQRVYILAALPGMLADLQHHRIAMLTPLMPLRRAETPQRNAPCSCGSGRKFKKCCGA